MKLAKKMKKNNIAVDFVNFGEEADNTSKLEAFINAINSSDNSHLATIPAGPHLLSDQLIATPVLGGSGESTGGAGGDASQFEFGFDPTLDPELALALRMSLEDEKQRQEKAKQDADGAAGKQSLEGIKEENENTPLLSETQKGEGSGSGSGSAGDKKKDDDKMDTA